MNKATEQKTESSQPAPSVVYYDGSIEAARKRFEAQYND